MNCFYQQQERAIERSSLLKLVLGGAIIVTTLVAGLAATLWLFVPLYLIYLRFFPRPETAFTVHLRPDQHHPVQRFLVEQFPWFAEFPWELFAFFYVVITLAIGTAIVVTTRAKLRRLHAEGGVGLARALGGVCITAEGFRRDDKLRRAVNVVSEIALASRLPAPEVYLILEEPGINAFAVGMEPADTVIALTSGCVDHLNREQLQGVVAHEFAHIAQGDTRTNILLVGYLHGLMGLVIAAQSLIHKGVDFMVRSIGHGGQGLFGISCIAIGALLWPVGLMGLVCAMVIKAAYSRQREYLADAKAVQFTRNALGVASAMKRILGHRDDSRVRSPQCLGLSHVFFAKSCGGLAGLIDSHPQLEERIRRIDAQWDGQAHFEQEHEVANFTGVFGGTMSIAQQARPCDSGRILELVDDIQLEMDHAVVMDVNEHATTVRSLIPDCVWQLTRELVSAETILIALWSMGQRSETDDNFELTTLYEAGSAAQQVADALRAPLSDYGLAERLMLFDASINSIRHHGQARSLEGFCQQAESLIDTPSGNDLFRWMWRHAVAQIVDRERNTPRPQARYGDVDEVLEECQLVLSALAYANHSDVMEGYSLLRAGNLLGFNLTLELKRECGLSEIDRALSRLRQLAPKARRKFVLAGSKCIEADSLMNDEEALLMRGICSGLGYPPATLLPGQPVRLS